MSERKERCGTCRFWDQCDGLTHDIADGDPPDSWGWCHRYPSSPYGRTGNAREKIGNLPAQCESDWCGEWKEIGGAAGPVSWDDFVAGLSLRAVRCLQRAGVTGFATFAGDDLQYARGLGDVTRAEIRDRCRLCGIPVPLELLAGPG